MARVHLYISNLLLTSVFVIAIFCFCYNKCQSPKRRKMGVSKLDSKLLSDLTNTLQSAARDVNTAVGE